MSAADIRHQNIYCPVNQSLTYEAAPRSALNESPPAHRFQTDFASVGEWLLGASEHLKSLSDAAELSDLNQECIYNHLIQLLVLLCKVLY